MKLISTLGTTLTLLLFSHLSQAVSFTEITYTPTGNTSIVSRALGISDNGSVVTGFGGEITGDLSQKKREAFSWNGTSTGIGGTVVDFHDSTGRGVSSDGSFIVGGKQDLSNPLQAFRRSSGGTIDLGFLPSHTQSIANDVSNDGSVVVGNSLLSSVPRAFRWVDGAPAVITDLGVLSGDNSSEAEGVSADGTVVAGTSGNGTVDQAFRWVEVGSVMTPLGELVGGSNNSSAHGISGDGLVVVGDSDSTNGAEAFRWVSSVMTPLGDLAGGLFASSAKAASQDGSTIVGSGTTASGSEAFIWDSANGMQNLKNVLVANGQDLTGWTLTEATSVSSDGGMVAGFGTNPSGNTVGWIADISDADLSSNTPYDFNGDNKSDIFWRHDVSNGNKIYIMDGSTITADVDITYLNDPAWSVVGNSDFNNDGKSDILWRNSSTGANQISLMNGTAAPTTVDLPIPSLASPQWKVGGVGDFDGDGNDDIFWHNDSGENRMTFMNGTAQQGTPSAVNTITDPLWEVAGIADFNLDGRDDVLWRHDVNKRVWMYQMNGNTITNGSGGGEHVVFTAANWNIDGVGDFDGDGRGDILWRNSNNGRVWMYLMNGITVTNGNPPTVPGEHVAFTALEWNIKTTGDYNGDGKQDILWRNDTFGYNHVYIMDGITLTPAGGIGINTLSDLNWKVKSK